VEKAKKGGRGVPGNRESGPNVNKNVGRIGKGETGGSLLRWGGGGIELAILSCDWEF